MNLAPFEDLLKRSMGLDPASLGSSAIAGAVKHRLRVSGIAGAEAYWDHLNKSPDEMQQLIEAVIVPETWFFRDRQAFVALGRFAREEWFPGHLGSVMRLLSLPCSTGEEPYSMAMALLDEGLPAASFLIDGIDISREALAEADRATYGKNSFRGSDLGFCDRYFTASAEGHRLAVAVSRRVVFRHGNLFATDFLPGRETYDVIFCRNMLIYFDSAAQAFAVEVLARLMKAGGLIFAGPSEASLFLTRGFAPLKVPMAFGFRRAPEAGRKETEAVRPRGAPEAAVPAHVPRNQPRPATPLHQPASEPASMEAIRRVADEGHLAEAARQCEEHLRQVGPSAEAFHLLGLIRDATGNRQEASEFYRKTLYLEPNHYDALVHLALILEEQGDAASARILTDRIRRLDQKKGDADARSAG